jgi:serpin B
MNGILQDIGVKKIFNDGESLNGIANELLVSLVQQNSYFSMDESGVEASSTTSAVVRPSASSSPTATMNVNRPFVFIIRENSTGAILFMGKVVIM